VIESVKTEDC